MAAMRVAILGGNGQVGQALAEIFPSATALGRSECDVTRPDSVRAALRGFDLAINCAAVVDVEGCQRDPALAWAVNAAGARWVAQSARAVVYLSSDYVFDGRGGAPYAEWAAPNPLFVYGASKLAGEQETLQHAERAWVVRTSWIFGGPGKSFVNTMRRLMPGRERLEVVADEVGGPTYAPDLARAIRDLVGRDAPGTYHLANSGEASRYEWARAIATLTGAATDVRPTTRRAYLAANPALLPRPAHSTLANYAARRLGVELRPWQNALCEHLCASR